jgi:hypothetical protein
MSFVDEMLIDELIDDVIYENEFMIVYKVVADIPTHSVKWVKRVQFVQWKHKKGEKVELDIRRYNLKENRYGRGISFSKREFEVLKTVISELHPDELDFHNEL